MYTTISAEKSMFVVITTNGTNMLSFVTMIFSNGQQSHGGDRKTFEVMTSVSPLGTFGSVTSLLAALLHQGSYDRNHKSRST
jgi:hypothetical protein